MDTSPFSQDAIRKAVIDSLNLEPILPPGKQGALIVTAYSGDNTVRAIFAAKVGEHWQFDGEADWHGGAVSAGISVIASW